MQTFKQKLFYKILFAILVVASLGLLVSNFSSVLAIATPSETSKTWGTTRENMPQNNTGGSTGMLPQYWPGTSAREVNFDGSRLNWMANGQWKATINGSIVYCSHKGWYVRYGYYDPAQHWLIPGHTSIQGVSLNVTGNAVGSTEDTIKSRIEKYWKEKMTGTPYYTNRYTGDKVDASTKVVVDVIADYPGGREAIGYFLSNGGALTMQILGNIPYVYYTSDMVMGVTEAESTSNMQALFDQMTPDKTPKRYSNDIDDASHSPSGVGAIEGPEVIVIENELRSTNGYAQTGSSSYSNNQLAYVLTAIENAYHNNLAQEYSLQDIQTAYWLALGQDPGGKGTAKGRTLFQYATDYANFASGGFQASINASQAQVIADRDNQTFTVGPFWVNYPEYVEQDISYVKSLSVNDGQLIYDENKDDFKVVFETGGTTRPGANGLMKAYPKNGEKFFIQFTADSVGHAGSIDFSAQFEYISGTTMDYNQLEADANVYKYYGYCTISQSPYLMASGSLQIKVSYAIGRVDKECTDDCGERPGYSFDSDGDGVDDAWHDPYYEHHDRTIYVNDPYEVIYPFHVWQPYIQMGEDPVTTRNAQPFTVTVEGERVYTVKSEKVTTIVNPPPVPPDEEKPINLTMALGGHVWVDEDGGKESISNGIDDGETRVPNVIVTLSGGKTTQTTKTDANGEYRFGGLDPMKQYSVTFTYNGQYYQPTTFASSSTWGSGTWQTNSNAKDSQSEREAFNLKFASIGSSPENYVGSAGANKSYTKQELLDAGVIDEFGNLIGGSGSMAQYVRDCMMNAYTFDLYPYPSVFVLDNKPVTRDYNRLIGGNPPPLYPDAFYINLGLDQRQDSDLAIKKDVDHVDLEINGQTHRYTYDTLETQINNDESWTIGVRVSDAFTKNYGTSYSRELYKSDYIYKASMYGERAAELEKTTADELEIYITYKVMIRNQALSIRARVDEFVDYYDDDLRYIDERSYIEIKQSREDAAQRGRYSVKASDTSRYSGNTMTRIDGYNRLYITGLSSISSNDNNNYLAAGQTAYVYLTFKVEKEHIDDEDWVILDEEVVSGNAKGVGKENIVEVNGYSTQYARGTQVPNIGDVSFKPAGIVDRDSNPGNLNPSDVPKDGNIRYENFEDDTDKAPNIRIILYRDDETNRVIAGNVWEDARTESIGVTTTGDGIRQNNETLINGVTVQLVELMENGSEYIWREFGAPATGLGQEIGGPNTIGKGTGTGTIASETPIINYRGIVANYNFESSHNGSYAFKSFMPGKYVVRFIYGDTVRTVTPSSLNAGGLNAKSYNGQDFKSTTYQEGVNQNLVSDFRKANVWKNEGNNLTYIWHKDSTWNLGIETLGEVLTEVSTFKADASNNETAVATQSVAEQKGYVYDITASDRLSNVSDAKDIESRRNQVIDYSDNDVTNYIAEVLASHKSDYETMNNRTQLLNDLMMNTKMRAETGMMVVELEYDRPETPNQTVNNTSSYKILNVDLGLEERPKSALVLDKEVTNVKLTLADGSILFDAKEKATNVLWRDHKGYNTGYTGNFMDESKFGSIANIRQKNSNKFGLIQLTMDEELMHGATIEITYRVTVTNVGEVDYKDRLFYYTGNKSATAPVVTTKANQVIDYVANNLQFDASRNSNWRVIEKDEISSQGLVNATLKEQVDKYNTIIITNKLDKDLVPNLYKEKVDSSRDDSVSVPLVLTQLITSENDSDDLTYRNMVEIVKTSNNVGRRMEYSVVGNQDPTEKPQELDSDISEIVRILPPFGNAGKPIIIIATTLLALTILTGGIFFIKKKVLKK